MLAPEIPMWKLRPLTHPYLGGGPRPTNTHGSSGVCICSAWQSGDMQERRLPVIPPHRTREEETEHHLALQGFPGLKSV